MTRPVLIGKFHYGQPWLLDTVKKERSMDSIEEFEMLRNNGLAEEEISRLRRLRRDYKTRTRQRTLAELRRLEFARWLVTSGRLTEQIA
jgi:hypothetical protein